LTPSPAAGAHTSVIASRTAASIAGSSRINPRQRCVYDDQTRFSPTGTGPVRPRAVGDDPMWRARVATQSSITCWLTSPRMSTSVGPRSSGTPMVQNHQLPSGRVVLP